MTEELFREDATLVECDAVVTAVDERGVQLTRTVFYPHGGGQAGDRGALVLADGRAIAIADTRKGEMPGEIVHVLASADDRAALAVGA
ncbi:MAG: alanine--tRNA ligase-related protein, partial [Burkholderiaceae bacterium]